MDFSAQQLAYGQTGFFSRLVVDYLNEDPALAPFYKYPISVQGIQQAIEDRKDHPYDRQLLVNELTNQYRDVQLTEKQRANLEQLKAGNCFTITTAHQPNIFTGPLYFIYKILHAVKLADELKRQLPANDFVPVYYMGSEDADLDELGHIYLSGQKLEWQTTQTGAVGRMIVNKELLKLIDTIAGQISVRPFGSAIVNTLRECYQENTTIEAATFKFVNGLFADYGLLILLPDNPNLKRAFNAVVQKELNEGFSHKAVEVTAAAFPKDYKLQASGREINLFYLKDDSRERIERSGNGWIVNNTNLVFAHDELLAELEQQPERFSANVILRPVFQEMILPNIAFIGGGGELAYWMELKKVFEAVNVPYPVLVLRNSFLILDKEKIELTKRLGFKPTDLFKKELELLNNLVKRDSELQLELKEEKKQLGNLYNQVKHITAKIDPTLAQHTEALYTQSAQKIEQLEKKMLRAEKKKFEAQQRQLHKLKASLFPNDGLQERVDNFLPYYAEMGTDFLKVLYGHSPSLEQEFVMLSEQGLT